MALHGETGHGETGHDETGHDETSLHAHRGPDDNARSEHALPAQLDALTRMSAPQLRSMWRRLHRGQHLPDGLSASQLARAISWRLQEKAQGGLPPARLRALDRLASQLATHGELDLASVRSLKPGTRLVRRWHGKVHVVTVLEQGFEHEERHYRSLTRIARAITGAGWSGPRFFGLRQSAKSERLPSDGRIGDPENRR